MQLTMWPGPLTMLWTRCIRLAWGLVLDLDLDVDVAHLINVYEEINGQSVSAGSFWC